MKPEIVCEMEYHIPQASKSLLIYVLNDKKITWSDLGGNPLAENRKNRPKNVLPQQCC